MGLTITLILAGIILILAELLLIPGVGVAGILGVLSICGASWYAFAVLGPLTGAIVTIFNVVALAVLTCFALRSRTWKKFELNTVIGKNEAAPEVNAGDRGKAVTRLAPMGTVRINEARMEATALEGMIDAGTEIEVAHIEKNKIYVRPVMPDEAFLKPRADVLPFYETD